MKIVFLDVKTIGEDIDLSQYETLGEVVKYDFSSTEAYPVKPGICLTVLLQPEKCQRLILKSPCLHDTEGFIKLRKSRP